MNIYSVYRLPFVDQMLSIPSVNIENISHMARTTLQSSVFEHIGHGATDFSLTVIAIIAMIFWNFIVCFFILRRHMIQSDGSFCSNIRWNLWGTGKITESRGSWVAVIVIAMIFWNFIYIFFLSEDIWYGAMLHFVYIHVWTYKRTLHNTTGCSEIHISFSDISIQGNSHITAQLRVASW